ncbi:39S ribosomal protein L33, mitochondrial-like isoform X2 [Odontomachus brunneus]|uniref:39S ribosomal protein L33, mitochondrial-like isoform X2 n=1 Tax=Odontomachus brunneus TaxID=486640 RepID=UPI0013F2906D|nr:39S ribosomal protein L33, mitochondrial-like isoform X2 [Odontomachus brunneus]
MLLTNVLLKPKSKNIMVIAESVVTGHKIIRIRERIADKLEFLHFDPYKDTMHIGFNFFL